MQIANNRETLAIIGGGAAGVATFAAAVIRRVAKTIYIVDPHPAGRGFAFSSSDDEVICNTSVDIMSVVPGKPLDFLDYLRSKGHEATTSSYVPRSWVGDYLVDRFRHYRELAGRRGIEVIYLPCRFRSLRIEGHRRYRLRFSGAAAPRSVVATDVAFCTGYGASRVPDAFLPYRDHPAYVGCPYPEADMLARIPAKSRVLVIGTKLSGVDTAILLCREGHRVTMLSPSGALPAVRARLVRNEETSYDLEGLEALMAHWAPENTGPCPAWLKHIYMAYVMRTLAAHTHKPGRMQLSHAARCDDRLREEIAIAEQGNSSWQDLCVQVIYAWNAIHLEHEGPIKGALHPDFQATIYRYLTAIALPNARKLMRHIDNGALAIKRGEPRSVAVANRGHGPWLVDWGEGPELFDTVVAAAGFHLPYCVFNDDGELEIDAEGRRAKEAVSVSREMAAEHPFLEERESIWFVGLPAHGRIPIPNALFIVAALADRVVANMMRCFRGDVAPGEDALGDGFHAGASEADFPAPRSA